MSRLAVLLITATLATSAAAARSGASCEWQSPGHDPFQGDVPAAVDHYTDIPASTRARLKARMAKFAYDDIITIRRDAIEGSFPYEPALLDMHFGKRRICADVTRNTWSASHEERALTYCEDGHCIAVPLICRNVSRILRRTPPAGAGGGPSGPAHPLVFEPPSAGVPAVPNTPNDSGGPKAHPLDAPPASLQPPPTQDVPFSPIPLQPLPPAADVPDKSQPPTTPEAPPPVVVTQPPPPLPPVVHPPEPTPVLPPPGVPPLPPAIPAVPEPATLLLWIAGLAAGGLWSRRSRVS